MVEGDVMVEGGVSPVLGKGRRIKRPSSQLTDFVTNTVSVSPPANSSFQSSSSGIPYPITQYVNCDNFSVKHRVFLAECFWQLLLQEQNLPPLLRR